MSSDSPDIPAGLMSTAARRVLMASFVTLWLISAAQGPWSDAATVAAVARNLVVDRTLALDYRSPGYTVTGVDGREYGKFPVGPSLVAVPGQVLERLVSTSAMPVDRQELFLRLVRGLTPAATGAAAVTLLFLAIFAAGHPIRLALLVTLLFMGATFGLPYLRSSWTESFQMLAVNLSLFGSVVLVRRPSVRTALLAGFGLGLLFPAKMVLGVFGACLAISTAFAARRALVARPGLIPVVVMGAVLPLAIWVGYDFLRFGKLLLSAGSYGWYAVPVDFSHPIHRGLFGLLFSSGRGLLWFAPAAVAGFAGIVVAARRREPLALGISSGLLLTIVLYAAFSVWHGGEQWGPRFLAPMLGPLALLASPVLSPIRRSRLKIIAVSVLAFIGLVVNVPAVLVCPAEFFLRVPYRPYSDIPMDARGRLLEKPEADNLLRINFVPAFSPISGHWWLTGQALPGADPGRDAPWKSEVTEGPVVRNADQPVPLDLWFVPGRDWEPHTRAIAIAIASLLAAVAAAAWFEVLRGGSRRRFARKGVDSTIS